jgi:hypothetical protein
MKLAPQLCHGFEQREGQAAADHRRHGRIRLNDITSSLGQVIDLSASGMRVSCQSKPPAIGAVINTVLNTLEGPMDLKVCVVWTRRVGWTRVEVGLEFRELTAEQGSALTRLAHGAS